MITLTHISARPQTPCVNEPFHNWNFPDGTQWAAFYRTPRGVLLRFPELADYQVSADGCEVACVPAPDVSAATTEHLYLNQVLPLALSKLGKLVFHASAVDTPAGAVAFLAQSGRGKSTLAASFAVNGHGFLTDDGLLLEPTDADYLVEPSHPSIRLWDDSHGVLVGEAAALAPAVDYTSKARLLAGDGLAYCKAARPLAAAYFLGEGAADDIAIKPLSQTEALIEWAKHSFLLDIEDRSLIGRHFDRIAALANRLPCFSLDYPRRYEDLARVRAAIVAHAATVRTGP